MSQISDAEIQNRSQLTQKFTKLAQKWEQVMETCVSQTYSHTKLVKLRGLSNRISSHARTISLVFPIIPKTVYRNFFPNLLSATTQRFSPNKDFPPTDGFFQTRVFSSQTTLNSQQQLRGFSPNKGFPPTDGFSQTRVFHLKPHQTLKNNPV